MTRSDPPDRLDAIQMIRDLSDSDVERLEAAFREVAPPGQKAELVAAITGLLQRPGDAALLVDTLQGLVAERYQLDVTAAEFGTLVADDEALEFDDAESGREVFARRVARLISADSLVWSAKANELVFEHERLFTHARIFCDIRPVFADDPTDVKGAVIVQTLRIDYVDSSTGEARALFFGLEEADLEAIEKAIGRAKSKTRALNQTLTRAGMGRFSVSDEDQSGS